MPSPADEPPHHDDRDQPGRGAHADERGADEERDRAEPDAAAVGQPLAEPALQLRARRPRDRADRRDAAGDDRRQVAERDQRVGQVGVRRGEPGAEQARARRSRPAARGRPAARRAEGAGAAPATAATAASAASTGPTHGHVEQRAASRAARPRPPRTTRCRATGSRAPVPGIGGRAQLAAAAAAVDSATSGMMPRNTQCHETSVDTAPAANGPTSDGSTQAAASSAKIRGWSRSG